MLSLLISWKGERPLGSIYILMSVEADRWWPVDLCPLYFTGSVGGKGGPVVINCVSSPLCNNKVTKGGSHIWCVCMRCWRATTASPVLGVSFILWCAAGTHFCVCCHSEMKMKGAKWKKRWKSEVGLTLSEPQLCQTNHSLDDFYYKVLNMKPVRPITLWVPVHVRVRCSFRGQTLLRQKVEWLNSGRAKSRSVHGTKLWTLK